MISYCIDVDVETDGLSEKSIYYEYDHYQRITFDSLPGYLDDIVSHRDLLFMVVM